MDYIKLSRRILEWEWYSDINTCRLFVHMLLRANWKDGRFQGKVIPRGSFVSSLQNLSIETALSIREVRTALAHLESTGEVTHKGHTKYSVFTVKNYDSYQSKDMQIDNQPTSERHSKDIQTTTIEEKKEGKKGRSKDNTMSSGTSSDRTPEYQYKAVIDYLNLKAGTSYRSSSKDSQSHIRARFKEGYSLEDFRSVVDKKVLEWKGTDMEKFLRPSTLFGSKFEGYLNQNIVKSAPKGGMINKFNNFHQRDYDFDDLERQLLGGGKT